MIPGYIYSNDIMYCTLHRQAGKASLCEREFARANVYDWAARALHGLLHSYIVHSVEFVGDFQTVVSLVLVGIF